MYDVIADNALIHANATNQNAKEHRKVEDSGSRNLYFPFYKKIGRKMEKPR